MLCTMMIKYKRHYRWQAKQISWRSQADFQLIIISFILYVHMCTRIHINFSTNVNRKLMIMLLFTLMSFIIRVNLVFFYTSVRRTKPVVQLCSRVNQCI